MAAATDLLIILLFSILGGVLAVRFHVPRVLGVLLAGALVGPNALGLLHDVEILEISIEVGAILLLFLIGMEFNIKKLLTFGTSAIIVAVLKLGFVLFASQQVAIFFGLDALTSLLIGFIMSITSTVIFLKILEQKKLTDRPGVSLLIAVLIIEDIYGVFALTFFSSLGSSAEITPLILLAKLIISLTVLVIAYMVLSKILKPVVEWLSKYSAEESFAFIAIGIVAGMSSLAHLVGLSTAVGAFLAGNIISSLKNSEVFKESVNPFILTFSSLFFFSIGTIVDFSVILEHLWLIITLLVVSVVAKFAAIGFSTYLFSNTDGKNAVFSGLAMVSLGEFSLLIAQEGNKLGLAVDLVSITSVIIFLSTLIMAFIVTKEESTYKLVKNAIPKGIRVDMNSAAHYFRLISLSFIFSKFNVRKIKFGWKRILRNIAGIMFVLFIAAVWYNATKFKVVYEVLQIPYFAFTMISIGVILLIFPTFGMVRNMRNMLIDLFKSFTKFYPKEIANEKRIFRNLAVLAFLFVASILLPSIVIFFGIDPRFSSLGIFLFIILAFVLMRSGKLSTGILQKNRKLVKSYYKKYGKMLSKRKIKEAKTPSEKRVI